MNGLEEIQDCVKRIKELKIEEQKKIAKIEEERNKLAQKRNEIKSKDSNNCDINVLGNQIKKLGEESQEISNNLDSNCRKIKNEVNFKVDNLVAEGIRKIRKIEDEVQEIKNKVEAQNERNARYKLQKQEFYARFGRMPELSENAEKNFKEKEKEKIKNLREINRLKIQIQYVKDEIAELAKIKQEFKNGNFGYIVKEEVPVEEIEIIEVEAEQLPGIEEIYIEEFEPVEELKIDELQIEELFVEEFKEETVQEEINENIQLVEESKLPEDEIEKLARKIVEEIALEQTAPINISIENENVEQSEDIITFETQEVEEKKEKVIIPLFGQKVEISNIVVKFEDGELVYKAQMSDEEEVKIYPSKISEQSVILRDKQNRAECEQILNNYIIAEDKVLDKKVIECIDPLICELLIECAEQCDYNPQELIYSYAMSFSRKHEVDTDILPGIIYNISYIEQSKLSSKEKSIINRICKKARKNFNIDVIESFVGFKKIKYILKRIFAVNNIKVLPDVKY